MLQKTRNIVVFLGLLVVSVSLPAQEKKDTIIHKVLLIPFKTTMLMSEIGEAVNASTHLSYSKISEAFRYRLDLVLFNSFKQNYHTVSFLQEPKKADTTLNYIYGSVSYQYDLQPGDSSGESHAEFDPKQQKTHFIHNGQLQVPMDYSKRFMNVAILSPNLLPALYKKYGTDIFVFVNELDIKNVANNETEDLTASNYHREVIVQYSIINTQKQYLAEGILTTYFPNNINEPKVIGDKFFSLIAESMVKEFEKGLLKPQPVKPKKATANHTKSISKDK
jgi:hypothetical protein